MVMARVSSTEPCGRQWVSSDSDLSGNECDGCGNAAGRGGYRQHRHGGSWHDFRKPSLFYYFSKPTQKLVQSNAKHCEFHCFNAVGNEPQRSVVHEAGQDSSSGPDVDSLCVPKALMVTSPSSVSDNWEYTGLRVTASSLWYSMKT